MDVAAHNNRQGLIPLAEMKQGDQARICRVRQGDKVYRQRLLAMGLLPGTVLTLARIAPLGDPIEIVVRGVSLSLRKHEAAILLMEGISQ